MLVASVAALGGFLFGYDTAVINGAVGAIQDHYHAGSVRIGFTVASALLGSAVGAWFAGRVADRIGRVPTMVIAAVLFGLSALGAGIAYTLYDLAFWRIVGGVAVGLASVIAPAYIVEVAPAHMRGRLGSLQQLAIVSGIFVSLLVDFALAAIAGGASHTMWFGREAWRWMFWAELIPAVAYGLLALTIPESPRYLVAKLREVEAEVILRDIVGPAAAPDKVAEIRETVRRERNPRLSDLRGPALGVLPIVWVGIGLSVFQQFVGINVIFYYSSVLWAAVGFSESSSLLITVITSVTNILTTLIAISLIDKIGRKPLLLIGSVGMVVTLGTLTVLFATAGHDAKGQPVLTGVTGSLALLAANLYVVAFGCSWGPVVWVLLGEMFPNSIRAIALSVGAAAQWIANFVVSTTFPPLKDHGLGLPYGIYTACALISILFVAAFVRETRGKELEQM